MEHDKRLFCLDVLRGLDMLLLLLVGRLVRAAQGCWQCFSPSFMGQFRHGWECFTLWDIIMPLFIFMCGAAIPFALERRLKEGKSAFWRHVLSRVALLWFLGCVCQGNLADLDPQTFSPYSNTLQAIATGYLVTAAMMAVGSRWLSFLLPVVLAGAYTVLLAVGGDYTQYGNFAFKVDHAILSALLPTGNLHTKLASPNMYTWFLTSMMFAVMTLCGYQATGILRSSRTHWKKAVGLSAYGFALVAVGGVASVWIPIIKPIFTLSFTALAMGCCVLALGVLYALTDVFRLRRGLGLVLLFGRFSLVAYMVGCFFDPVLDSLVKTVGAGIVRVSGTSGGFVEAALASVALVLVLVAWKRMVLVKWGGKKCQARLVG